eukprot:sb/3469309/
MSTHLVDFVRIFTNPWDTVWWLDTVGPDLLEPRFTGKTPFSPSIPVNRDPTVFYMLAINIQSNDEQWYIGSGIATMIGIKQCKRLPYGDNPPLESLLKKHKYAMPPESALVELSSETGQSVKSQQRWIRRRQQAIFSTRHTKFTESSWRFVFYGAMFTYGITSLWNEDYFWETKFCWIGYPFKVWAMKDRIYWYYMIELGYYMSCLVLQFYEVKRKDFKEMFIHHVATVFLIS